MSADRPQAEHGSGCHTDGVDDDAGARRDGDHVRDARRVPVVPTWVFVVVPAVVVGLLVGIVAVAARSGSDDDGPERLGGPAAELPAVAEAVASLLGNTPDSEVAGALGQRAGEIAIGLVEVNDDIEFVEQFDRLPDDEARLLGRSLGSIQRELSPSGIGGPRGGDDRGADTVFALELVWAAAQVLDPAADPTVQAFNVLPASVPLAENGDDIAAAVVAGDMVRADELLQPVLSEAGAAEVVSGLAGDISDRLGERNDDRLAEFQDAYNLQIP